MYLKIHRTAEGDEVVAVCDRELLNTNISRGEVVVCVSEKFYGSRLATPEEVGAALLRAENANLMGERTIELAENMGLVKRSACLMFGNVPHAQLFRI